MHVTRRYWTGVALIVLLGAWSLLLAQPSVLAGAVLLGAWLLTQQYTYVRDLERTLDELTVEVVPSRDRLITDTSCSLVLTAEHDQRTPVTVAVTVPIPVGAATTGDETLSVELDKLASVTATTTIEWPIAGTFEIGPPDITVTDHRGLFRTTLNRGPTSTVTVDPRHPRNIQIRGSDTNYRTVLGEHETGQSGAGIQPAELRAYQPGDAVRNIDWKATARLTDVHVREFEIETDRTTALIVDHRSAMGDGLSGETKLDYARHVALLIANSVHNAGDPLGLYTIGDKGLTEYQEPQSDQQTFRWIQTTVSDLVPTAAPKDRSEQSSSPTNSGTGIPLSPAQAQEIATQLAADTTTFGQTLAPYYDAATPYVRRIEDEPLFRTVRTYIQRLTGPAWVVIITDDSNRTELREAINLARRDNNHVLVALTPSVLFQRTEIAGFDEAQERHVEFEEFRRDLDRITRVTAIEIAPGDRFESILAGDELRARPDRRTA